MQARVPRTVRPVVCPLGRGQALRTRPSNAWGLWYVARYSGHLLLYVPDGDGERIPGTWHVMDGPGQTVISGGWERPCRKEGASFRVTARKRNPLPVVKINPGMYNWPVKRDVWRARGWRFRGVLTTRESRGRERESFGPCHLLGRYGQGRGGVLHSEGSRFRLPSTVSCAMVVGGALTGLDGLRPRFSAGFLEPGSSRTGRGFFSLLSTRSGSLPVLPVKSPSPTLLPGSIRPFPRWCPSF